MNEESKFSFIFSLRFWALVIGSASTVLVTSFGTEPWYISLGKFLGLVSAGFISMGTIDKFSKKNTTTTVTMPDNVSSVSATTSMSEK